MRSVFIKRLAAAASRVRSQDPFAFILPLAALGFAGGIFLSPYVPLPPWVPGLLGLFCLLLTARGVARPLTGLRICLIPLMVFTGLFNASLHEQPVRDWAGRGEGKEQVSFTGTVAGEPELRKGRQVYVLQLDSGEKVLLQMAGKALSFSYGDHLKGRGLRENPPGPANPGGFDYRAYLQRKGVTHVILAAGGEVRKDGTGGGTLIFRAALAAKEKLLHSIDLSLPREEASLLKGVLFGQTGSLEETTVEHFRGAGLAHILSVSGLHVGLLMGSVWPLAQRLFRREGTALALTASVLLFYAFLCGLKPCVLRALVMGLAALGARVSRNPSRGGFNLALASLVVLVTDPLALHDAGFQLSFTAAAAIIFLAPAVEKALDTIPLPLPSKLSSHIGVTLSAQLGVLPLTALYFNEIPLLALFSNLLAVPLIWAVTVLGLITTLAGLISTGAASFLNYATGALLWLLEGLARITASVPGGTFIIKTPTVALTALWYLGLILAAVLLTSVSWRQKITLLRFRWGRKAALPAVSLAAALLWANIILASPGQLEVTFLSVGEGDAIFIRTPAGHTLLVDTGVENAGKKEVLPFLMRRGVTFLDYLVLTHGHEDHAGGAQDILSKIKVGAVLLPQVEEQDIGREQNEENSEGEASLLPQLKKVLAAENIPWQELTLGDRIFLEQAITIDVLNPLPETFQGTSSDLNNNSIVFKLSYNDIDFLLTADVQLEALAQIKKGGMARDVEVFKVPHHGSRGSLDELFYRETGAKHAIISVGRNFFGHPAEEVLDALSKTGMEIIRTDEAGAVTFYTEGSRITRPIAEE